MARYIAGCSGRSNTVTRLGSKNNPARAFARGWNIGSTSYVGPDSMDRDTVSIGIDGGSNNTYILLNLGDWRMEDGQLIAANDVARIIHTALQKAGLA